MPQQQKKRPLSRYVKEFKHRATHCEHCRKALDRITLTRNGEVVNKATLAQLNTLTDDTAWQEEQPHWAALCRFCSDLHSSEQNNFFNIIGFKQYLVNHTDMRHGTIREYVVRLRRLGNYLSQHHAQAISSASESFCLNALEDHLPATSTNNYRIALRKYDDYCQQRSLRQPVTAG